jgi:hypothetical protein
MSFLENPYVINAVNQTASIPTTNVFVIAPPAIGMWAIWADVIVTSAGTGGTVTINVSWNNGTTTAGLNSSAFNLNAAGEQAALLGNFYSITTSPITYSTTVNGASGNPVYTLRLRFQFLG